MVTVSTTSCVSARSGADSHTKLMQVTRPAPPSRIERREAMELGLVGCAECAGDPDRPRPARKPRSNWLCAGPLPA